MRKKVLALLMTSILATSALVGCGSSEKDDSKATNAGDDKITATITVWGPSEDQSDEYGKWLQTMCEKFNEQHENWDLTFEYGVCSEGDAGKIVPQDPSASGDVYMFANDQLQTLIGANAIAKLGGETATYIKETNDEMIVNSVTVDGNIYGIPFTTNTWFMYYDKSAFTEDDIKSIDAMIAKEKISFPLGNSWYVASWYAANGCTFFGPNSDDADAKIDFAGDKATEVTKYLVNLAANKNFVNDDGGAGMAGLRDGSVKAMFSGSWDYGSAKEALGDNLGIASLPSANIGGEAKQLYSFSGSKAIAVNPNCKYQQVAVALAKFLASEYAQQSHYDLRNIIPCNTALLKQEKIKNDPLVFAQNDTVSNTSIVQPFVVTAMNYWWTPAENFGKSIVSGEVTLENAADKTAEFNNSINTSLAD